MNEVITTVATEVAENVAAETVKTSVLTAVKEAAITSIKNHPIAYAVGSSLVGGIVVGRIWGAVKNRKSKAK